MVGGVVSAKVMCCVQVEVWLPLLMAIQVRSMPVRPVQLAGVVTSVKVTVAVPPPQSALAVATPVLLVAVDSPHCNCRSSGQSRSGAPVFSTVTVFWQARLQVLVSVTVRLSVNEPALLV